MWLILNDLTVQESLISLQIADANKDKALSTVSHELRTPITALLGMFELMEGQTQDSLILQNLDICKSNAKLLLNIVNSILDLQLIRANKLKIFQEDCDIYKIMENIQALFRVPASQKDIQIELDLDPSLPREIYTDKQRLTQILINLTANALKFTFHGSITLGARSDSVHPERIWFWVKDTGIGIKEQDIQKLFKMFGKLEDPQKINTQGVGLGLTISNNLVKLLNQNDEESGMRVESVLNKGTTFSFYLSSKNLFKRNSDNSSLISSSEENLAKIHRKFSSYVFSPCPTKSSKTIYKPHRKYTINTSTNFSGESENQSGLAEGKDSPLHTILLVDDNPFNFIFAKAVLEKKGCKVLTAYNGKEAIEIVKQHHQEISFVLMDCQMPIMDGFQAPAIIKKKMEQREIKQFPVYALTANEIEQEKDKFDQAKMDGYIRKPLGEAEINKILRNCK